MMKVFVLLCLFGLTLAKDYTGYQVWRFYPKDHEHEILNKLVEKHYLDVWSEAKREGDFMDINIGPKLQKTIETYLKYNRIDFNVWIPDLQALIEETKPKETRSGSLNYNYNVYHTFDEIENWMSSMESESTDSIKVEKVLVGTSYEKRDFYALKISTNVNGLQSRKAYVTNCGIHAREWISPATCQYFAHYLISNFKAGNSDEVGVLSELDFYITPVSNPDGYVYTWDPQGDRMWRKTRTPCDHNNICYGTDPNRNFDVAWGSNGASTDCCSDLYCGPSAFSEPCTAAQRDFVESIENVVIYFDIHSYSQEWMFPYAYTTTHTFNYNELMAISNVDVKKIEDVHGKVYEDGEISTTIYVASGSTVDYFFDNDRVSCDWAVELRDKGRYGFLLPEDQIQPNAEEVYPAFIYTAQNADSCF